MADHTVWCAFGPDTFGQVAGINACNPDPAMFCQPVVEMLLCTVARRIGNVLAQDAAKGDRFGVFDVFVVGADIADMGEGKGDHLTGVRRVGHDFLIARDRGVEADFTNDLSSGPDAASPKN